MKNKKSRKNLCILIVMAFSVLVQSCATIPEEAVELSVTLGRDLVEVHRAHKELSIRYFDNIRKNINNFVDEVYRPYTIKNAIKDFQLIEKLVELTEQDNSELMMTLMDVFVTEVSLDIEDFRSELLKPIGERERAVLTAIDDSYQRLQNANSIVTGHLASIRKVEEAQAELLKRTKLEDLREMFIEETVKISEQILDLVEKGRKAQDKTEEIEKVANEFKKLLSGLDSGKTQ